MNISFLLHLYQPFFQEKHTFDRIYGECYSPLLKTIKAHKDSAFTLNVPFGFLQLMYKFGHEGWIQDVHELIVQNKVELTGSGAYHPLFPKISQEVAEKSIILNECGLAHFFGRHQGFEGEEGLMIKDLNGFFPPEMAVDNNFISFLDSLSYKWVIVDEPAIEDSAIRLNEADKNKRDKWRYVYQIHTKKIIIVVRNKTISDQLAFKRDANIEDISFHDTDSYVISLDGETFGHHNKSGIVLFDKLLTDIEDKGGKIRKISDLIENSEHLYIDKIRESTWAIKEGIADLNRAYYLWDSSNNRTQALLWKIFKIVENAYIRYLVSNENDSKVVIEDVLPYDALNTVKQDTRVLHVLINMLSSSDVYWWSSNATIHDSGRLFDYGIINTHIFLFNNTRDILQNIGIECDINELVEKLSKSLLENENS